MQPWSRRSEAATSACSAGSAISRPSHPSHMNGVSARAEPRAEARPPELGLSTILPAASRVAETGSLFETCARGVG